MKLKHIVKINVTDRNGRKQEVLRTGHIRIPERLLTFLFGELRDAFVIMPSESVEGIVIRELRDGDEAEARQGSGEQ